MLNLKRKSHKSRYHSWVAKGHVYMEANNESKMQKLDYIESNVCFFSQSQPAIIHCHIHIHINIMTKPKWCGAAFIKKDLSNNTEKIYF